MSLTYNKRMSNYRAMLPITPHNYRLNSSNTIHGGNLTGNLPETAQDWQNLSTNDITNLTPDDISKLSYNSFVTAFTGRSPLTSSIQTRLANNNPIYPSIIHAIMTRLDTITGGDFTSTATPATPALPETVQDWKNMSTAELQQLTAADINNLSDASFTMAFTSVAPLGNLVSSPILGNNKTSYQALMQITSAINNRVNLLEFWVPPNDPSTKAELEGIPSFWLQHPNNYVRGKSQNVMYGAYQDFQDTSFYTKYSSRLKAITPPRKFARYMNSEIPGNERNSMGTGNSNAYLDDIIIQYGQKWRVMFFQGDLSGQLTSGNDYYVYYIDSTGLPDYLDMLNEFYNDRDTMQPEEVVSMLGTKYRAALAQKLAQLEAQYRAEGYSAGDAAGKAEGEAEQQAKDEAAEEAADEAAKETSSDSSDDIWGTIGHVAEIGAMFI